jgi:hypothetical protein
MSDIENESENDKVIIIFEIYSDENNEVYHVLSESCMQSRIRLIKQQYKEFLNRKKCRKSQKQAMLEFIQNQGGLEKVLFRKLKTIDNCSKEDIEELLLKQYLESTIMRGKIVKNNINTISKKERCKQYYKENREKHLQYVKTMYQKQKKVILETKRKKYNEKIKNYKHCNFCNKKVLTNYYEQHINCKNHLCNVK